jgi:hypothetical protein
MEQKRIEEADRNVRQYITDGLLKTRDDETKKLVPFFMDQAEKSLRTAAVVLEPSAGAVAQDAMGLELSLSLHCFNSRCYSSNWGDM